jgi:hypothetical protein
MKRTRLRGWFVLAVVGTVFAFGCEQAADRPATYPVTGQVTLNGEPVDGATVTFVPSGEGQAASAVTDASGNYALSTFGADDGAVPGQYNVKIVKYPGSEPAAAGAGGEYTDEMYQEGYGGAADTGEEAAEPENLLPEKYADASTSGLTATVQEGDNNFDFALEG